MSEVLQIRSGGQIILSSQIRRKAKLNKGDTLEVIVQADGSILLVPVVLDRSLPEKHQLEDIKWAKTKNRKKQ